MEAFKQEFSLFASIKAENFVRNLSRRPIWLKIGSVSFRDPKKHTHLTSKMARPCPSHSVCNQCSFAPYRSICRKTLGRQCICQLLYSIFSFKVWIIFNREMIVCGCKDFLSWQVSFFIPFLLSLDHLLLILLKLVYHWFLFTFDNYLNF